MFFVVFFTFPGCSDNKKEEKMDINLLPPPSNVISITITCYGFDRPYKQVPANGIINSSEVNAFYKYVTKFRRTKNLFKGSPLLVISIKTKNEQDKVISIIINSKEAMLRLDPNNCFSIENMEDFKKVMNNYMLSGKLM